jgi:polyisoprenoid-binding protein YceI
MKTKLLAITLLSVIALAGCNGTKNTVETLEAEAVVTPEGEVTTIELSESSQVAWEGKALGKKHNGVMGSTSGTILVDENRQLVGGEFTIDMSTIRVLDLKGDNAEKLKNHLSSEGFFDVENYPTASFVITNIEPSEAEDATHTISGNLEMKGETKNISFDAEVSQASGVYAATAEFEIDRTEWGVNEMSGKFFEELGDNAVSDAITLRLDLEASQS